VEYAADAVSQHRPKALIVIGHIPSEQPGMEECTRWLQGFVKTVPVEFVPAKQPFWTVMDKYLKSTLHRKLENNAKNSPQRIPSTDSLFVFVVESN